MPTESLIYIIEVAILSPCSSMKILAEVSDIVRFKWKDDLTEIATQDYDEFTYNVPIIGTEDIYCGHFDY